MSLAFLYPMALLGALAVAVPLWLHLHRRFQGNVVRFSAIRFLHDEPLARRAPLKLQHPLLFALRALAILLLAGAFAWPYDRTQVVAPSLESRVYLFDNTLSHQADDQFATAREELADLLESVDSETQVAVVELASQPRIVVPFGQDPIAAAKLVRDLKPTFERGSYAAGLRLADTLLHSAPGDRRQLVVISDHQTNQYDELAESPMFLSGIDVESPSSSNDPRPNLALARPQLRRMLAGDRSLVELSIELYHRVEVENATLEVSANGKRVFERAIEFQDQPDRVLLTMRWTEARGAAIQGEAVIAGEPDALLADNRVFFALPPVRRGRVALAAQSLFLKAAFAPDVMQEAWEAIAINPGRPPDSATRNRLADVLCIESHHFRDSTAANMLVRQYLDSDRGVLIVLDDASREVVHALSEFGFEVEPEPVTESTPQPAGYVQRDHAIFQPFRSPDFGRLSDVHFKRHFRVRSDEATPLLFDDAGNALLFESGRHRKVLVATFPIEREATDWPLHTTFVPFLDLCFQFLRHEPPLPTNLLPREVAVFHLPTESEATEFTVSDGQRDWSQGKVENRRVQLNAPPEPGNYLVRFNNSGNDADADADAIWLAVNSPPAESELEYSDPTGVFDRIAQDETSVKIEPQPISAEPTRAEILRQRIWWFVLLVALLLFFGENLLLAMRSAASTPIVARMRRAISSHKERWLGRKGA